MASLQEKELAPLKATEETGYNPDGRTCAISLAPSKRFIANRSLSTMHAMDRKCSMNNMP